jgi:hypothetical protein
MLTWKLVGGLRVLLMMVLAVAPLASGRGGAARDAAPQLAADVDGDGRLDRVRLGRYADAWWLDVELARDGGFALRSTTRVAAADAGTPLRLRAVDGNGDGKMDVLVEDAGGRTTLWLSNGEAFEAGAAGTCAVLACAR